MIKIIVQREVTLNTFSWNTTITSYPVKKTGRVLLYESFGKLYLPVPKLLYRESWISSIRPHKTYQPDHKERSYNIRHQQPSQVDPIAIAINTIRQPLSALSWSYVSVFWVSWDNWLLHSGQSFGSHSCVRMREFRS